MVARELPLPDCNLYQNPLFSYELLFAQKGTQHACKLFLDCLKERGGLTRGKLSRFAHIDALLRYASHCKVLKHIKNDELFVFRIVPEMFVMRMSEKKEITPESMPENLDRDVLVRAQDSLEMCLDGCPMCLHIIFCEMSAFLSKYMLSRRLVEIAYNVVRDHLLIDITKAHPEEVLDQAFKILESDAVVYLRATPSEFQSLLRISYSLLGQLIGKLKAYIKNISFDWREGFIVKMEAS